MKKKTTGKSKKPEKTPSEFTRAEDHFAAVEGNTSSMEELVSKAKNGDDKAFLTLIKNYTITYIADKHEDGSLLYPQLDVRLEFYKQEWVQEKLKGWTKKQGSEGHLCWEKFWGAVFSTTKTDHLKWADQETINRSATIETEGEYRASLKTYIVSRRDKWNKDLSEKRLTFQEVLEECEDMGLVTLGQYPDIDSFRRFLNGYGVVGTPGRLKKREIKN